MEEAGDAAPGWGTALALAAAVVLLSALDAVPLVTLPLAIGLLALPLSPRWKSLALGAALWVVGFGFPIGPLADLSRGWSLLLGGAFIGWTLWRPQWPVLTRALLALGVAALATAAWLAVGAGWTAVDGRVREHLLEVANLAFGRLQREGAASGWMEQLARSAGQMAELQWRLFPALLALQSIAALGLASWLLGRIRGVTGGAFRVGPLRDFRFSDQLVWLLVLGLVLLLLPLGAVGARAGANALLFMGALYAVRGLGVLWFLLGGAPSAVTILFGVFALLFLYPLVLATAVLVGLSDTWLDVRGRAAKARRP